MPTSRAATVDLLNNPLLSDAVRALARRGELRRYAKGVVLIQEGDFGDTLYVIVEGKLRAYTTSPQDGREFHYGTYGPGEYVGEMGLDGGPRSANVIAVEPTVCAVIARPTLKQFIGENTDFAFELLVKVIARARAATIGAQLMATRTVYGRLRWLLESLAVRQPDGSRLIEQRLTHLEISSRLGCGREMVSRVMKELVNGEFIARADGGGWVICRELPAEW